MERNKTLRKLWAEEERGRQIADIFWKRVLSSGRRNAAGSDATPVVTASANQSSPSQSRHTGRACRASLTPDVSAVVTAEICCTIAGKAWTTGPADDTIYLTLS